MKKGEIVVSGFRPSGRLHLGHLHGALRNWVQLQEQYACFFIVADWHALTTEYARPATIQESTEEMVIDWLSIGLDPARAVIFRQSHVKEHAELHLLLSMITPTPWLIRNPTVKEQARELGLIESDDEAEVTKINYGYLGYPVLQAADILLYKAHKVPVGIDQLPHVELTREIARRFNSLYRPVFPEPGALLTATPKIPGTDGRKMSKSYHNAVFLSDPPEVMESKLSRMMTDPRRVRRQDPGEPEDCPAFNLHRIYCTPQEIEYVSHGCRTAGIGCLECKKIMSAHVIEDLAPYREKRRALERGGDEVQAVLQEGRKKAQQVAAVSMEDVRLAVGL